MPRLSDTYAAIKNASNPRAALLEHSFAGLSDKQIAEITSKSSDRFYRGKVRDLIIHDQTIEIIHSDRLTAFDRYIDLVPYKGLILNRISSFWLDRAKEVIPTHLISQKDDRTLLVKRSDPVKVEVVVRGYLAGSMARAYAKGEREFCGVKLPEGLVVNQKLPELIITPTTKAPVGDHDEPISAAGILERGLCTKGEWETICEAAYSLFRLGSKVTAELGWILVDTKYEFGRDAEGNIILIDEIHTPDSSRFWVRDTYGPGKIPTMLDKQNVRQWLLDHGFDGHGDVPQVPVEKLLELGDVYLKVAEALLGSPIEIKN